jgi:hypothetical protein
VSEDTPVVDAGGEDAPDVVDGETSEDGSAAPKAEEESADAKKWKALALKHEKKAREAAADQEELKRLRDAGKSVEERNLAQLQDLTEKARQATIKANKASVGAEKGLPTALIDFLPDIEDEVDMVDAAERFIEAIDAYVASGRQPKPSARQAPKSSLTNPLGDDNGNASRDAIVNSLLGKAAT